MNATNQTLIQKRLRRTGPARSRDLVAAGHTRSALARSVAAGELVRVSRGLYAAPDYAPSEHGSLAAVATRAPSVVFCLLTALRLHGLTTQAPFEVWIAIGNKSHPPRMDYPLLLTTRFSDDSLLAGVELKRIDGVNVRVTNVAKTVADCFKFRNKIGLDVALEALREARKSRKLNADELWKYAKINRVAIVMRPYLDALA
jgi:predicted transcriptional regulator of viral defense system